MNGMDAFWRFFVPGFVAGVVVMWVLGRVWRTDRGTTAATRTDQPGAIPASSATRTNDPIATNRAAEPIAHSRLIDVGAARAAGFNMKHADDLTILEGIGPRIEDLLHANGVDGFAALAAQGNDALADILEAGGANFRFANPSDWARQAALAADNQWAELKQLQRERIADAPGGNV